MAIDKELQKYYEDRFEMCSTRGWKDLMFDIESMLEATNKIDSITDLDQLKFKQGEISIMRWLLSIEQMSRSTFMDLKEGD